MRVLQYIGFSLFLLNMLFAVEVYERRSRPITLTHLALEPVIHIFNAKLYFVNDHCSRSREELSLAIRQMYLLRAELHREDIRQLIDLTLPPLLKLHQNLKVETTDVSQMNTVLVKSLLALAYIQVQHAQMAHGKERHGEVHEALGTALYIVKKALILSEGSKRDHEVGIFAEMHALLKGRYEENQVDAVYTKLLGEIRNLEIDFSH